MVNKSKPITPSRRHYQTPDFSVLTKEEPFKPLVKKIKKNAGRNNQGRITSRFRGGGVKKLYREIDFGEEKINIPGEVKSIEYDPYRSSFIALVSYKNGAWGYILAPDGLKVGDEIICAEEAPLKIGNRMKLIHFPVGSMVYNIETIPLKGGKLAKSAGSYAEVLAQEGKYTHLRLPSGEVRKVLSSGFASYGRLSNIEWKTVSLGKAGRLRLMGFRPTVRGRAMNPVDHPYGGGEGRTQRGTKRPKTIWGKVTGGRKTRPKKKYSDKLILQRRKKK